MCPKPVFFYEENCCENDIFLIIEGHNENSLCVCVCISLQGCFRNITRYNIFMYQHMNSLIGYSNASGIFG